jgi:hypothetical protein
MSKNLDKYFWFSIMKEIIKATTRIGLMIVAILAGIAVTYLLWIVLKSIATTTKPYLLWLIK